AHTSKLRSGGWHGGGRLRRFNGNPHQPRARRSQLFYLNCRGNSVAGIGVGHGRHHHRRTAPYPYRCAIPDNINTTGLPTRRRPDGMWPPVPRQSFALSIHDRRDSSQSKISQDSGTHPRLMAYNAATSTKITMTTHHPHGRRTPSSPASRLAPPAKLPARSTVPNADCCGPIWLSSIVSIASGSASR